MLDEKNMSIYAVEVDVGKARTGNEASGYHSYLMLVDETDPAAPKSKEELHFLSSQGDVPFLCAVTKRVDRDLSLLNMRGYIGGKGKEMLKYWNYGIRVASEISDLNLQFSHAASNSEKDEESIINCRAGVKAVIEALGMKYEHVLDILETRGGSQSNILRKVPAEFLQKCSL